MCMCLGLTLLSWETKGKLNALNGFLCNSPPPPLSEPAHQRGAGGLCAGARAQSDSAGSPRIQGPVLGRPCLSQELGVPQEGNLSSGLGCGQSPGLSCLFHVWHLCMALTPEMQIAGLSGHAGVCLGSCLGWGLLTVEASRMAFKPLFVLCSFLSTDKGGYRSICCEGPS